MPSKWPLRILMLHNAYQIRGGEEESAESECLALQEAGHHVTYVTTHNDRIETLVDKAKTGLGAVWNQGWYQRVAKLLRADRFDILHVQNTFPQISPSVYFAAEKAGVPVVQAVRNYRYACPAATTLRNTALCTDCVGRALKWPAIRHGCYRGSALGSATVAAVSGAHHVLGTWRTKVDRYLPVSDTVAQVLLREGFPSDKMTVKPCFTRKRYFGPMVPYEERRNALFVGRLSEEKGISLLLRAWAQLQPGGARLQIIGTGDVPTDLPENVDLLGRQPPEQVQRYMANAAVVVMPGAWPEPFGRVAVEAFAQAAPVIATRSGGLADIVVDNATGALFAQNDADALARHLANYLQDHTLRERHGQAAEARYANLYTPERNAALLEDIYADVLAARVAGMVRVPA